jgi:hypothetical protein
MKKFGIKKIGVTESIEYKIMIIIVLLIIAFFIFMSMWNRQLTSSDIKSDFNLTPGSPDYADYVCANIDRNTNQNFYVYPSIIDIRDTVTGDTGMYIEEIHGDESTPNYWNEHGVVCQVPSKACDNLVCMNIFMKVPVNFTEWKAWHEEIGGELP